MAKQSEKDGMFSSFVSLSEETKNSIYAVLFFALGLFLLLASFNKSGTVGSVVFSFLELLMGVGYYLIPILLFILGASFYKSEQPEFVLTKALGSFLFFFSGLGLIDLLFPDHSGGIIGSFIAKPFVVFFDVYAGFIFLASFFVISILLLFDAKLSALVPQIPKKFSLPSFSLPAIPSFSKKDEDEDTEEASLEEDAPKKSRKKVVENEDEDEEEEEEEEEDEEVQQKPLTVVGLEKKERANEEVDLGETMTLVSPMKHKTYTPPPLSLLSRDKGKPGVGDIKANANIIKRTLQNFGINIELDEITVGPSVTRYALKPAEGVKLSRIVALQNDLGLALAAHPLRIEAPIPGKSLVGIEVPNTARTTIGLEGLLSDNEFVSSDKPLLFALGKGISGESFYGNLAKLPHLLIAGTTGSGKSVTIHTLVTSLLYRNSPENLRFIMVDPKRVELTLYNKIPHLLTPVITEPKKAILSLKWAAKEMDRRYEILEKCSVRDISSYHKNIVEPSYKHYEGLEDIPPGADLPETMPYIVVVIDELADIMATYPRELEGAIVRLAQMSRAVGIHLILSTQRPSVNVITGLIKANVPGRLALQVSSGIDSRTILDQPGAEKLLGAGDMLYLSSEMKQPHRIQSAFLTETEVKKVVKFLADEYEDMPPSGIEFTNGSEGGSSTSLGDLMSNGSGDEDDDELYEEARQVVMEAGKASTSYIQRKLKVGYARAARLMDILEERGVIGPADGAKPREVLIGRDEGYGQDEV